MPNLRRRHSPFTMANLSYLFVLFILNFCITARFKPIRFVSSRGLFFSPFWLGRFFVGVTLVNGTRIWLDSIDWESDGLSREIGEIVGVLEFERIGEDRFSLCRISCSYNERSWRFLRAGDFSGFTISFNPTKYPCSSLSSWSVNKTFVHIIQDSDELLTHQIILYRQREMCGTTKNIQGSCMGDVIERLSIGIENLARAEYVGGGESNSRSLTWSPRRKPAS